MQSLNLIAQLSSIIAFFLYGVGCFYFATLIEEFDRYGLSRFRRLVGSLQIAGALGLLLGFIFDPMRILCASCLGVMMFFALLVRAKIKDPLRLWIPAFLLFLLNLFVALR